MPEWRRGRVVVEGGTVLSLDRAVGNLVAAAVLIEDGVITEVGRSLRARNADLIDATDTIVMPGFVDCHRHAWHTLFRDLGPTSGAELARECAPDDVYAA